MAATATTAAFDAQARKSDRSNGPCRVSAPQRTAPEDGKGRGRSTETQYTAKFREHLLPTSPEHSTFRLTTMTVCRSSGAPGMTATTRSGRRSGFCGTLWSRLETSLLGCLLLTPLCRRWWTSWRMCCRSSISLSLRRRSKCPRSPAFPVLLLVGFFLCRKLRNSWWTCHCQSGCGWLSGTMPPAWCGPAHGSSPRGSTGAWRFHRQPRAVHKYWARAPPVVSMTMQLKFQQSIVEFFKVPQLQFFDRVVATSVASQRQGSQCKLYRRPEIPRCSSGWSSTCPLVCKRQDLSDSAEDCGSAIAFF